MGQVDELIRENEILRFRLSRLIEANLRINESREFETILQEVLDAARSLTNARYGVITIFNDEGHVLNFLASGMKKQEASQLWTLPEGMRLFEYLTDDAQRLRVPDLIGHMRERGLPDMPVPGPDGSVVSFLAAPLLHGDRRVGNFFLAGKETGPEFTIEDEQSLAIFASDAALVVSNARRYREERQARIDMETLIDTSPVGVVVFNAVTGSPISFNQEARRIVAGLRTPGQPLEQLLEILTFRREDGRELSLQEFPTTDTLGTGETVRAEEIVIQVPDGRSVTVLVNATPIFSDEKQVLSLVVTIQDMTQLEELERLRAEFLAIVSHELRTPLSSIKGSIASLLDPSAALNPAETVQFHEIINRQADQMRALISDLLDVAKIDSGMLSVSPEPTDIILLIEEARDAFLSGRRGQNLEIEIESGLPWVIADRLRLLQVFHNLLSNAAKNSVDSSTIRMTVALEQSHVMVSVADEGRGFTAEGLMHLFGKYVRLQGAGPINEAEGAGLGLAICKGIVEAHGGRIWAESDGPGLGSRFVFTIPVADEKVLGLDAGHSTHSPSYKRMFGEEQIRILAVEDNPHDLRYVRDVLSNAGYIPVLTGKPQEAIQLLKENNPKLVLLDLVLPGVDGIELMKKILETDDLPVIFLSAYGRDEVVAKALEMGAVDFLVKPFSPTELVARIGVALRNRAITRPRSPFFLRELAIDYTARRVTVAGKEIQVTPMEYRLLVVLSANAGKVTTYNQLLREIWDVKGPADLRPMRTVISNLRRKMGDDKGKPSYIITEPRIGYRIPKV